MPLSLRTKDQILTPMLDNVQASGRLTDFSKGGVARMFLEGTAASLSDLDYSLYTLLKMFYRLTADGDDLDVRGLDRGLARDQGEAASDPVTYTRVQTWLEDIPLPAPQVLQATLANGTAILYRSQGDAHLWPQGRSISGQAPGVSITGGSSDQLRVNLDGDGAQTITLGTQTSGAAIATAIQSAVRGLTANTVGNQPAYDGFRCDYTTTTAGAFTLRSGSTGPTSSVVVTPGTTHDATVRLKLGLAQGGQEMAGQDSVDVTVLCDEIGVIGNVGAGQIQRQLSPVPGIFGVANALMFSNGRERASDDSYRQDLANYPETLIRGTQDAIPNAVYNTLGADGKRHVMSAQVLEGAGIIQVYLCDGRSLTAGAQADVIQDVQDELDGLGQTVGGWRPVSTQAGVAPATIRTVAVNVTVLVGPTADLLLTQQAVTQTLYQLLYRWSIGVPLSYDNMTLAIRGVTQDYLGVSYLAPAEFSVIPPPFVEGVLGQKLMPGTIAVTVQRA